MQIYLLRHGQTEYNAQHRYQGQQDIPLSAAGRAQLRPAGFMPDVVYVSPLIRARQTAEIFFPGCPQIIVQDLREMCFGSFEGRHYIHIEHDPDYLAWLEANKTAARPDGERIQDFCNRSCAAFAKLVEESLAQHKQQLVDCSARRHPDGGYVPLRSAAAGLSRLVRSQRGRLPPGCR